MNRVKISRIKGLTLTEVLVYLAVFGAIFAVVLQFALDIQESNNRSLERAQLEKYSVFLDQHLEESFADSVVVDVAASQFEIDSGALALSTADNETILYETVSDYLQISRGGAPPELLTPNYVQIDSFYLEQILGREDEIVGVRLRLEMRAQQDEQVSSVIETNYLLASQI
ncbi:MAG: PulJ/GspJ family protein [Candidatus Dojkabacteria bacterium]